MTESLREPKDRLKEAREAAGFDSALSFAKAHELTESTYGSHENGTRALTISAAQRYAPKLGVDWRWLMFEEGVGPKQRLSASEFQDNPRPFRGARESADQRLPEIDVVGLPRDLPVMGVASCGSDGQFEFEGGVIDYIRRPPRFLGIRSAYAIYANGDSMVPWVRNGQAVPVHPGMPVQNGDRVVVQIRRKELPEAAYLKELVARTPTTVKLLQYNPRKFIELPQKSIVHMHRVMEWQELLGI